MNKKQILFIILGGFGIACIAFLLGTTLPSFYSSTLNHQGKLSQGVNFSRQLHIAYQQYLLDQNARGDTDSSIPTVSTLAKEGYLNQTFLDNLIKNKGIYVIYISPTQLRKSVSTHYLSEDGSIQINDTGDGTVNPNAN